MTSTFQASTVSQYRFLLKFGMSRMNLNCDQETKERRRRKEKNIEYF